jgi:hypothetical protein
VKIMGGTHITPYNILGDLIIKKSQDVIFRVGHLKSLLDKFFMADLFMRSCF